MDQVDLAAQQDALRPVRQFVNLLSGVLNDQTWSTQDARVYSPPGGYQSVGAYGASMEGTPVRIAGTQSAAGLVIPQPLLLIAAGAALVYFLK